MELRQLTVFLAIAEELHFGRASERLHLAQSSVSQRLRQLEREVGVQLVARTSHRVALTPAGETFRVEARRVIEQAEHAMRAARQTAAGAMEAISIGFNFAAGQLVLPKTLARLRAEYPQVKASLWEKLTGPQLAALKAKELDLGLLFGRPPAAEFGSREMFKVPLVAIVRSGHPWAGRDVVPMGEVARQPCVMLRREHSPAMHDAIVDAAVRSGTPLNVVEEMDDPTATAITVQGGDLVAFASRIRLPHSMADNLVALPLVDPTPMLGVCVAWRSGDTRPTVRAFLDCLRHAGPFA
ncbi:LysR substrate-binding domain-containing protein [Nonomuraea sp. NPDC005650]|uniref:LysR family transcriptional regulator n=1 Tax=Nonomuraea sp. NPDC005650 TaxID=3157045 RepID=UPI0033A7CAB6